MTCVVGTCLSDSGHGPDHNLCPGHASPCTLCGDPWAVPAPGAEEYRFCSKTCADIWRRRLLNRADRVEAGLEDNATLEAS